MLLIYLYKFTLKNLSRKIQMRNLNYTNINRHLQNELTYINQKNENTVNVSEKGFKNRKKRNALKYVQPAVNSPIFHLSKSKMQISTTRRSSMPELNKCTRSTQACHKSRHGMDKQKKIKENLFQSKYIVHIGSDQFNKSFTPFGYPKQTTFKIYRCQIGSTEGNCCCSCNSDAMFEVMKGLYDCYKKKNCNNCSCVLCGHLQREDKLGDKIKRSEGRLTSLKGKTPEEKEKILRDLAMRGLPLPEGQTPSEKNLIDKVRADLGLPPEPTTKSIRHKHEKAAKAGILQPLEGKTPDEKEKILKGLFEKGIPLPVGRTPSEKSLIAKIMAGSRPPSEAASSMLSPSERLRKAKAEGLMTPLEGKTPEQKEKILRGLAMQGIPLPEGQTSSEKKLIKKIRTDLGIPIEPKTKAIRDKHEKAAAAGLLLPLEGKTPKQKKKLLQGQHKMGIPLPLGRTPSEKSLIAKIMTGSLPPSKAASSMLSPSERLRKAKAEGLLTPLKGKTPEQKEKVLRALAAKGLPLPEGQTPSEKKLIDKVRADLGLPPEPKSKSIRDKHEKAAGKLLPLEGKTLAEKEKILKRLHDMGIPLPVGRTPSEKSLIAKIMAGSRPPSKAASSMLSPSERLRKAKAEGLLTPLKGKTPEQKEKVLRGLAAKGLPLPEGQTPSEKKLIDKVRADLGLPPEPKSKSIRDKHEKAAGKLLPLEGKTPAEKEKILKRLHDMGIPLPVGRTPSEKSLIAKIMAGSRPPSKAASSMLSPSERLRKAKAEGLLTPLKGKTPEQKEKVLKGLAAKGLPLPEGQTPSEKKLIDKVRADLGLPPEPKSKSIRDKHEKAAGKLLPLEGKTPAEKERILKSLHKLGIPLPEGRTPSEKSLIAKISTSPRVPSKATVTPSERMRRAKTEGLLTPLKGKSPEQREKILKGLAMRGIPLPEGQSPSEKKLIDKIRADLGLPIEPKNKAIREKHDQAALAGILQPLEGKTPAEKENILKGLHNMGIPLPIGRTPSEKSLIAKVKAMPRAPSIKTVGLLTSLKSKTPEEKEKILRGLAAKGLPLPEGQTTSEKKLIDKVRANLGLPPEPKSKSIRDKHEKAAGKLLPLEGKTPAEKEKILKSLHKLGIPLPEGRTPSEKSLIAKISTSPRVPSKATVTPSERMRRAKTEGLLTPLKGKSPEQREKILKGLAMRGIPLPEGQSLSEKKLITKVRADLGLPIEPKTKAIRNKHEEAAAAGMLQPLEGKTPAEKENILKGLHDMGIPLPVGRTPSEKSLIAKISAGPRAPSKAASSMLTPSDRMRKAKAEGLLTPLEGKTPEQKEKILKGLAMRGIPLPEGQSPSEKKLIDKVRADLGLPPEPKSKSIRDKHEKAAGKLLPLEGKTPAEKEKILKSLHKLGIPLPEGRTPSEKSLIAKISAGARAPSKAASSMVTPSEQMRKAKAEGLLTPLEGKTPEQKEKILKGLAMRGIPLPEGQSPSEKKLINKVRTDLGLPIEPKTKAIRDKHEKAAAAGLLLPLEGKTPKQKEKLLRGQHKMGIPLPVGRTPSEKSLIAKVIASSRSPSVAHSEQMRRAKAEGLLTPLKGKTPEQREKILRALAMRGIPLPEGQSPSEKKLIDKVRGDLGLPIEPKNKAIRDKHEKAALAGILLPLEGKTPKQKENILRGQHKMGIPLPVGRTPSEKSLIAKVMASSRPPSLAISATLAHSEHMRRAKAEGLLTPLAGKPPEQQEKILKGLAMRGIPLPEGQSPSEKKLIDKIRADLGLPIEPKNKAIRDKHDQAAVAGVLLPLEGKTPKQKENILRGQHKMGIPLPVGRTPSEKSLIAKVRASSRPPSLAHSEKMRNAKAEGLLTPLEGKTPEQREKILKGLAMRGIPLPEGKSPSEQKLIGKVRGELGLPIEPVNKAIRDKHEEAAVAGLLLPLEGKTPKQKENILKGQHKMGIPLPVGRTPSEKSLIAKVMAGSHPPSLTISEKLLKAKAEGLLTPLKGKTPDKKEKILRSLAAKGLPLPEPQTPSEKKLVDKVRAELGLPLEPKSKSIRDRHEQAAKAGKLLPLEGKTPAEKEKILNDLHNLGIPLPEGRTPSEKSLITKIRASPRAPSKVGSTILTPSERLRRAKAEGLLTPLKSKTPEQRENILKGLAMRGIPLPEGQSPSEKKLINKVRADLGLPIEPKTKAIRNKHEEAAAAGMLQPLEGKTPAEKEKILKRLHDMEIPLPEGRTPSEKSLIAQISASPRAPSKVGSKILSPSERMRRAKVEGLLTPLEGKTPEQREKILKGLAMRGIPLPEGKSPSEKKLITKVRADLGLPIEPKTKAIRNKHEEAAAAGMLQPLEGKTPAEKEKILKGLHDMGIPLPVGRTPSEKSLIAKISAGPRAASKAASSMLTPSERMRKAKTEGLLTPLKGKTPEQKEKVLKGLAMLGVPLPEGQSPSEKKLIDKVRADLGLPPEPKSKSIRDKHEKAAGKLLPLEGKTPAEKEKILKSLHKLGIPLPEGRTASEKSLISKIKAGLGGKKSVSASKKGIGIGATPEYEEIIKTDTCDRGCGCDKKKIRFKHSYVKIRVTSPDISSLCDCDYECIPGVKNGAFIDSDGIKVTVGSAVGIPSYTGKYNQYTREEIISKDNHNYTNTHTEHKGLRNASHSSYRVSSLESGLFTNDVSHTLNSSSFIESCSTRSCSSESDICLQSSTPPYEGRKRRSKKIMESLKRFQSLSDTFKDLTPKTKSTASSLDSIFVIKSEMSLSFTSTSNSRDTISLMSVVDSSITFSSEHISGGQSSDGFRSHDSLDEPTTSDDSISHPESVRKRKIPRRNRTEIPQPVYTILRMSETKLNIGNKRKNGLPTSEAEDPVVLFNHLPSNLDVSMIIDKIMSKKRFSAASSIFIVVPTSDDEAESSSVYVDSIMSIKPNVTQRNILSDTSQMDSSPELSTSSNATHDAQFCGKGKKFYMKEVLSSVKEPMYQNKPINVLRRIEMVDDREAIITPKERKEGVGTDVAERSSEGHVKEYSTSFVTSSCSSEDHYTGSAIYKQNTSYPRGGSGNSFYWRVQKDCTIRNAGKKSIWFSLPEVQTPPTKEFYEFGATVNRGITSSSRLAKMGMSSTASLTLPRNEPSWTSFGDEGCKLFRRHKPSTRYRLPDKYTLSSDSLVCNKMVLSATSSCPSLSDMGYKHFRHDTPGHYHLHYMRTPSTSTSLILKCHKQTSPALFEGRSSFFQSNQPARRSPDMPTPSSKLCARHNPGTGVENFSSSIQKTESCNQAGEVCGGKLYCGCRLPHEYTPTTGTSALTHTATCPSTESSNDNRCFLCRLKDNNIQWTESGQESGGLSGRTKRQSTNGPPPSQASSEFTRTTTTPHYAKLDNGKRNCDRRLPTDCAPYSGTSTRLSHTAKCPSFESSDDNTCFNCFLKDNNVQQTEAGQESGKYKCGCRRRLPDEYTLNTVSSVLTHTATCLSSESSDDKCCDHAHRKDNNVQLTEAGQDSGKRNCDCRLPYECAPYTGTSATTTCTVPCGKESGDPGCSCKVPDESMPSSETLALTQTTCTRHVPKTKTSKMNDVKQIKDRKQSDGQSGRTSRHLPKVPPPSLATTRFTRTTTSSLNDESDRTNHQPPKGPPPSLSTSRFTRTTASSYSCYVPLDDDNDGENLDCSCRPGTPRTEKSAHSRTAISSSSQPTNDCDCNYGNLENSNVERINDWQESAEPFTCSCLPDESTTIPETSEITRTLTCPSHVLLDNGGHHGRLGHNMRYELEHDACHGLQNHACPCVPDISEFTNKPTPFCPSNLPLGKSCHPSYRERNVQYDPDLGCHQNVKQETTEPECPCHGDFSNSCTVEPQEDIDKSSKVYADKPACDSSTPINHFSDPGFVRTPKSISEIINLEHGDTLSHSELTTKKKLSTSTITLRYPNDNTKLKCMEPSQANLQFTKSLSQESYHTQNVCKNVIVSASKKSCEDQNITKKRDALANKELCFCEHKAINLEVPTKMEPCFCQNRYKNIEVSAESCFTQNISKNLEIPTIKDSCLCQIKSERLHVPACERSCLNENKSKKFEVPSNKESCFCQNISNKKLNDTATEKSCMYHDKSNTFKKLDVPCGKKFSQGQNKSKKFEVPACAESCRDQHISKKCKVPATKKSHLNQKICDNSNASSSRESFYQEVSQKLKDIIRKENYIDNAPKCSKKCCRNKNKSLSIDDDVKNNDKAAICQNDNARRRKNIRKFNLVCIFAKLFQRGKKDKTFSGLKPNRSVQTMPDQELQPQQICNSDNVPQPQQLPFVPIYNDYPYQHPSEWIDQRKLVKFKSELSEMTSGFKASKKKKEQCKEIELTFEDAIKYYAGKNLDQFRDLLTQLELDPEQYKGKKGKKLLRKKKAKEKKEQERANKQALKYMKSVEKKKKKAARGKGFVIADLDDEDIKNILLKHGPNCKCSNRLQEIPLKITPEELEKLYPKGMKLRLVGRPCIQTYASV